jgi:membrane protease YdiL (CAAX protease family)
VLKQKIQQYPLLCFYGLSIAIALATIPFFILPGVEDGIAQGFEQSGIPFNTDLVTAVRVAVAAPIALPGLLLSLISLASVDIAVMIVAKVAYGQKGLTALKQRFRFWSPQIKWQRALLVWVSCILTFSAMNLATGLLNQLTLAPGNFNWRVNVIFGNILVSFLIAMFLDAGALFEENGWRGFALPLLQNHFSPLSASLILGLMWFGWHIPIKFDIFSYGLAAGILLFAILIVKFVLLTIIMTYFWNVVGGTTIIAISMHGLSNDSIRLAGQILSDSYAVYLISEINLILPMLIVAIVLIWKTQGKLGFNL